MADSKQQSLANHTRFDPMFHFFLVPVFLATLIVTIVHLVRHPGLHAGGMVVVALGLLGTVGMIRGYSLKVQDRVIRLEERLRLATLLGEPTRSRIGELTVSQLVALRFAADGEVAGLATRALNEKLSNKEIKAAIQNWRADYFRV